jgi:hypothetical protein
MAVGVNVTGSANDAGPEAAGGSIGLVPGDVRAGTPSPMGQWHLPAELAELTVGGPEERHMSVLMLGVEAI